MNLGLEADEMAHDVFISHSSKDKPIADAICAKIEAAGVRCWIAPRDIAPGEDWPAAISRGISQSRVMVLVFSSHSNSSEDVSRELFLAANCKLVIIPFKIENIEPEPGKQYYLARMHWLDAINPPTQEQIQELVSRVKVLVPPREPEFIGNQTNAGLPPATTVQADHLKQPGAEVLPGSTTKPISDRSRLSRWFWLVPVGVLLIFLLGWAASGLFLKNPASPIQPTTVPTFPAPPSVTPVASEGSNSFFEDFSSNSNYWPINEISYDSGEIKHEIVDGKYIISLTSKQDYHTDFLDIPSFHGKDFILTMDVTVRESTNPPGDWSFTIAMREVDGLLGSKYNFILWGDGRSELNLDRSAPFDDTVVLWQHSANSHLALEKGVKRTISIKMDGPTIAAYMDGQEIQSVTDNTIEDAGSITLVTILGYSGNNLILALDNLSIQEIP